MIVPDLAQYFLPDLGEYFLPDLEEYFLPDQALDEYFLPDQDDYLCRTKMNTYAGPSGSVRYGYDLQVPYARLQL